MGKTAAELREEIEQQRAEVGRDLDAIGDRVSPGRIVERKTEAVKGKFRGVKDAVMGTADDAGESMQNGLQKAGERVDETRQQAVGAVHHVTDTVGQAPDKVRSATQGNPLAVGLVAFGVGLLGATLIPTSRREREMARQLQPQLEDAARRAAETGRELGRGMVDDFKPEVEHAMGQLKEEASGAAQRLTDDAKGSASDAAAEAKSAMQQTTQGATH